MAIYSQMMIRKMTKIVIAVAMFFIASAAYAGDGVISVADAWARATPKGANTAAIYLVIKNNGKDNDQLTGVDTLAAKNAEVHMMMMSGETMAMRDMDDHLPIPAGATIKLSPNHYHIMLVGLKQDLVEGNHVDLTLHFMKAGDVKVTAAIKPINYSAKSDASTHNHTAK